MQVKVGERVGAMRTTGSNGQIIMYGYGTYLGEKRPSEMLPDERPIGGMGQVLVELDRPNPCIRLDNDAVVWGCECWWAPEQYFKNEPTRTFEYVDIAAERKEWLEKYAEEIKARSTQVLGEDQR